LTDWKNRIIGHGDEPLDEILFNPANWRIHPKAQQEALEGVLSQVGFVQDVIINKQTGHLVDGHLRCQVAARNGEKTIPAVYVDLTPEEESLILATIDPLSAMAATDKQKLDDLLHAVQSDDARVQEMMSGLAEREGLEFGKQEPADAEPQIDRAAELNEKWQVKTGDLWQIGEHRLLCGDSTKREDVERVIQTNKASMCFTSPPYAEQRDYKIGYFDWLELMTGVSEQAIFACKENASILINLGLVHVDGKVFRYWDPWIDWMEENEQPLYGWYVWDKMSGLIGDWRGRLAPAHEWIFHFANKPNRANKTAPTKYAENGVTHYKKDKVGLREKSGKMTGFTMAGEQVNATKVIDSVIRCQPQRGGIPGHPAPFSVEFASTLIEVYSQVGEYVYEPFCGSGTSIVACQNLGRMSLSVELEPQYCAVILERMATAFPDIEIERL